MIDRVIVSQELHGVGVVWPTHIMEKPSNFDSHPGILAFILRI